MPTARKSQISLIDTPYYHCISRCVRRAFLCGKDKATGKSYEHGQQWVEDKLLFLGSVFAIDICAYAVMSNHNHLVLFVDEEQAQNWSVLEVVSRWHQLFKGTLLTQQFERDGEEGLSKAELVAVEETAQVYRQRLMDISWFMRVLNEDIARRANREDGCTGRFWEGRFKSQALLDEAALAACMAYVDLNPIRAKMAATPEESDFTSIQLRIKHALRGEQPKQLATFVGNPQQHMPKGLAFELRDYMELVELTGRGIREDKAGHIEQHQPAMLTRLHISADNWLKLTTQFTKVFHGAVGHEEVLSDFQAHQHRKRRPNLTNCEKLLA